MLLPFAVYLWGVRPYRAALSEARDRLATERETLARERGAVATARRNPELQHMTDSVLQVMQPQLFEGRDDVMASSELAAYLGDIAQRHHVWMQDAATRPATSTTNGVRTLHVEIRAESDFQGILSYLQALERGDKLVRIERIDISHTIGGVGNEHAETLALLATISGYAMGNTTTAPPANAPVPMPSTTAAIAGGP